MPDFEDLSVFFNLTDFALSVTVDGNSVNAIFDNEYIAVDLGGVEVESLDPRILCQTSDVASVVQGDPVVVNSVNYTVAEVRPDGTGLTLLRLRAT